MESTREGKVFALEWKEELRLFRVENRIYGLKEMYSFRWTTGLTVSEILKQKLIIDKKIFWKFYKFKK